MMEELGRLLVAFVAEAAKKGFEALSAWAGQGLGTLIEWFWTAMETSTTPRLSDGWFHNELFVQVSALAFGVTVVMLLAATIQGALSGRPEHTLLALRQAAWSVVATLVVVTVMTEAMWAVDEASKFIWEGSRADLRSALDGLGMGMAASQAGLGLLGLLMQLILYVGLLGLGVSMGMRGALIYLVTALCPLVFSSSVMPMLRESSHKVIHTIVALIGSKLAVVVAVVVAVRLLGNSMSLASSGDAGRDAASALGAGATASTVFLIAALSPVVLYKLMPTIEGAVASSGIGGGWSRGAMSGMYAAKAAVGSHGARKSPATRPVPAAGPGGKPGGAAKAAGPAVVGSGPAAVPLAAMKAAAKATGNVAKSVGENVSDGATAGAKAGAGPRMRTSGAGATSGPAGGQGQPGMARARHEERSAFDALIDKGWLDDGEGDY
jgi:hypothetical protein